MWLCQIQHKASKMDILSILSHDKMKKKKKKEKKMQRRHICIIFPFNIYLFIWLFKVLVATHECGIFSSSIQTLSCGMWDLVL